MFHRSPFRVGSTSSSSSSWLFLLLFTILLKFLPPVAPLWPKLDSGETEADVPGAHSCLQPYPQTPPICTGSAVNLRKELTIQARTPIYKEHRCTNLYWLNSCSKWMNNTHTHTHILQTKCCPNPLSVPDSSHPGVRPGVSAQGPGSLWAAGLANPTAAGCRFSN